MIILSRSANFSLFSFFVAFFLCAHAFSQDQIYSGPLFDAMAQIDQKVNFNKAVSDIRKAGVRKVALFARSLKRLGQNERALLSLRERNPDLVVLGAPKYFLLSQDLDRHYIAATIKGIKKHGYVFVGEILYTHADKTVGKQTAGGERYVDPSAPGTIKLLKALIDLKVPLMTHWEVYAWERDWPRFDRLYAEHPDQVFIIPHMAFGSVKQVRTIFSKHPNVHMTLSKKEKDFGYISDAKKQKKLGPGMLDEKKALKTEWRDLLTEYQDRVLFATDVHVKRRWKKYGRHVSIYRSLLGQLPKEISRKIAYHNAEKLYGVRIDAK